MVKPETWMKLTPHVVQDIHKKGGTILVSDRGKFVLPSYASFECIRLASWEGWCDPTFSGNPPHMDIAKMLQEKKLARIR